MRLSSLGRVAVVTVVLFVAGCESKNKGKLEATRWKSMPGTVKGQRLEEGALTLSFGGNGQFNYTIIVPGQNPQTLKGTYDLSFGDQVVMHFDKEIGGAKTHHETVVVDGNKMTMTDTDGTSLSFKKVQ